MFAFIRVKYSCAYIVCITNNLTIISTTSSHHMHIHLQYLQLTNYIYFTHSSITSQHYYPSCHVISKSYLLPIHTLYILTL